jgi:hypothetical protein
MTKLADNQNTATFSYPDAIFHPVMGGERPGYVYEKTG